MRSLIGVEFCAFHDPPVSPSDAPPSKSKAPQGPVQKPPCGLTRHPEPISVVAMTVPHPRKPFSSKNSGSQNQPAVLSPADRIPEAPRWGARAALQSVPGVTSRESVDGSLQPFPSTGVRSNGNSNGFLLDRQGAQVLSEVDYITCSLHVRKWTLRRFGAHGHAGLDFRPVLRPALTLPAGGAQSEA